MKFLAFFFMCELLALAEILYPAYFLRYNHETSLVDSTKCGKVLCRRITILNTSLLYLYMSYLPLPKFCVLSVVIYVSLKFHRLSWHDMTICQAQE